MNKAFTLGGLILLNIVTLCVPVIVFTIYKFSTYLANRIFKKENTKTIQSQAVQTVYETELKRLLTIITTTKNENEFRYSFSLAMQNISRFREELQQPLRDKMAKIALENQFYINSFKDEEKLDLINLILETKTRDNYLESFIADTEKKSIDISQSTIDLSETQKNDEIIAKAITALSDTKKKDELIEKHINKLQSRKENINHNLQISLNILQHHSDSKKRGRIIYMIINSYLQEQRMARSLPNPLFETLIDSIKTLENHQNKNHLIESMLKIIENQNDVAGTIQRIKAANELTTNRIEKLKIYIRNSFYINELNTNALEACLSTLINLSSNQEDKNELLSYCITFLLLQKKYWSAIQGATEITNIEKKDKLLKQISDEAKLNNQFEAAKEADKFISNSKKKKLYRS